MIFEQYHCAAWCSILKTEQKKDTLLMPSAQIVKVPKLKQVLGASNPWVLGTRY